MQYRNLGNTGVKVSPICLGTLTFGAQTDDAEAIRMVHEALDRGINFLDTANIYNDGQSEVVLGKAIAGRRDEVVLATKARAKRGEGPNQSGASRLHLMRELEGSLKRLGVECIDLYYVHAPDYDTAIDETLRAMDDMVRQGKVHYLACSNFRAWRLCEALWASDRLNLSRFVCVQPLYNIVNRDIEVELLPLCQEYQLAVVSYSPLARGILTGKYKPGEAPPAGSRAARQDLRLQQAEWRPDSLAAAQELAAYCRQRNISPSQFALAWCLANPLITSVIAGPRTLEQFHDNLGCLEVQLTPDDEAFVDRLVPPGEHTGKGFQDPAYPILGRPRQNS